MRAHFWKKRWLCLPPLVLTLLLNSAFAQLLSIKSVPVATADQFLLFPSENLGMGSVTIAVDDPPADPYSNPAKGARLNGMFISSAPVISSVTQNHGTVRTLPAGILYGSKSWFGGLTLAIQEFDDPDPFSDFNIMMNADIMRGSSLYLIEQMPVSRTNEYAAGFLGTRISGTGLSLAASVFWADLQAVGGVDLLYSGSSHVAQDGHIADLRVGLLSESTNQPSFALVLLHNRFRMTHHVYRGWIWESVPWDSFVSPELSPPVKHQDYTDTWGLQIESVKPLAGNNAQLGLMFTANRKTHPKIPNYELMNIPRDPGDSWVFNFGAGASHTDNTSMVAIDVIYEPIMSNTWADAADPVETESGRIIPAGGKTVENDFKFSNWKARLGLEQQDRVFGFQVGIQLDYINYRLKQKDNVAGTRRTQRESWIEWTPSIGFNLRFPSFRIYYTGLLTTGTGRPGVIGIVRTAEAALGDRSNFVIAPSGSLTLQDATVFTHQLAVVFELSH